MKIKKKSSQKIDDKKEIRLYKLKRNSRKLRADFEGLANSNTADDETSKIIEVVVWGEKDQEDDNLAAGL